MPQYHLVLLYNNWGLVMAISLKLDDALKTRVRHIAEIQNRSSHWIMCEAIKKYIEKEEAQEEFVQEALSSWAHYKETGLHLTGKEVQKWLNTWGNDDEMETPKCHR